MGIRANQKIRELVKMADKIILSIYGLEKDWESSNSSGQYDDQLQDSYGLQEAARERFSNRVMDLLNEDKLLHPNHKSVSPHSHLCLQGCG